MDLSSLVQEFANVGFTLLVCIVCVIVVNWLDRNIFNKHK